MDGVSVWKSESDPETLNIEIGNGKCWYACILVCDIFHDALYIFLFVTQALFAILAFVLWLFSLVSLHKTTFFTFCTAPLCSRLFRFCFVHVFFIFWLICMCVYLFSFPYSLIAIYFIIVVVTIESYIYYTTHSKYNRHKDHRELKFLFFLVSVIFFPLLCAYIRLVFYFF